MSEAEALDLVAFGHHLAALLGENVSEDSGSAVAVVERLLRLAVRRQCDGLEFLARTDGALDVVLCREGLRSPLPTVASRGSVVSRLFVLGGLEKGEEARARAQCTRVVLHGIRMVFATEPVGRWQEHLRVRLFCGTYVCSGCLSEHSSGAIHVLPSWSDDARDFVTAFRCDRCWHTTLAETRRRSACPDDGMREKFQAFLRRHGTTLPPADSVIAQVLDRIASGEVVLDPR